MKKQILGIKIDDINLEEALKIVDGWLKKGGKHYIVTTNPEFIVTAQDDQDFKKILNKADLSIPDGKGLKITGDIVCNIPGVDFMEALVKVATVGGFTVGFLGGGPGVAERCAERLKSRYPKLKISYALSGPVIPAKGGIYADKDLWIPDQVRDDKGTDILFVAFGPPKQEKWIYKNLPKIPIKLAMGVGGAFDYLSARIPRAPKLIRDLGLEWLFRLLIQPWRMKRQLALIKYLMLIWNR